MRTIRILHYALCTVHSKIAVNGRQEEARDE